MRLRLVPSLFFLRTLAKHLSAIVERLDQQNAILLRLAEQIAPQPSATDPATIAAETGVEYVDPIDQDLLQRYSERIYQDTGHVPTDDELLIYLADEKTHDLHIRLQEREQDLARLAAERRR